MSMRRFVLQREVDVSGVSGTGLVAEGIEFTDGVCIVRWVGERQSTVVWSSIDDVETIHGHGGSTQIVWVDPAERDARSCCLCCADGQCHCHEFTSTEVCECYPCRMALS